jgi:hydroxyacylglutathione hydrolase
MLVFEQIHTPGIAQLSYLIGDDSTGLAAVIDPRPDADVYLDLARKYGLGITHILETHIHADFMSGARELQERLCTGEIYVSEEGGAKYEFEHEAVKDGDRFELGSVVLETRHTPGHTPEHVSFLAYESKRPKTPWAVFSGDSLFVDSVGRPDLLGSDQTEELAKQLFATITGFYRGLPDDVLLYPGHGAGSSCGPDIGDRKSSSMGFEKHHNKYLNISSEEEFIKTVLESAPPVPRYYSPMKRVNASGPDVFGGFPCVPPLTAKEFNEAVKDSRNRLIDTRSMLAFGGGHIRGGFNIGERPELSVWAGWWLKFDDPILLVLEKDTHLEDVVRLFWRTGYTNFAGYLVGSMKAWDNAGLPLETLQQRTVHELKRELDKVQVVDVRSPAEWEKGHIPHARHVFLPFLKDHISEFRKGQPIVTYCDSGYRASLAASILKQEGFSDVRNVPGSWQAWTKAGFPVADGKN